MTETRVTRYETVLDMQDATLGSLDEIVDTIRAVADPDPVDLASRQMRIVLVVGPGGSADDMWDLRDVVEELESDLAAYLDHPRLSKPTLVGAKEEDGDE